ncbi:uncharacterized protein LOC129956753 [Argiope bruennichi]|uniref:uncharacterized protein LOC129956753 n=1 Tax=Argiope bruennichi TaxID=94029 RepID=UPI002493DB59|nr:uncharacterized protein LOC129956753 [Argiope bruennichi]
MYKLNTVANRFFSRHHHLHRRIYTGAFEPYVLFGYGAWGHRLKFKQIARTFEIIQRRPLIKILKAFRTTSTHALQVLAGILPLHLRAKELFANSLIKVQKTQVKFDDTYLDPELYEPTFNPSYDQHPCEWFTFPFQKNQPSGDGIEIFTDGSKIGDRVGSAIACFFFGKLIYVDSHRLDDHSTVFQAEAYAFFMALDYIDQTNPWSKVSIYSDSLSLFSALASPKRKSWMLKQIADK